MSDTPLDRIAELMDPILAEKDWGLDWPPPETQEYLNELRVPVLANVEAARRRIAALRRELSYLRDLRPMGSYSLVLANQALAADTRAARKAKR